MATTKMINTRQKALNSSLQFFLTLCLWLAAGLSLADSVAIDRVVAIVNDGVIFSSQVDERLKSVYKQMKSKTNLPLDSELRQQVLERLIVESLQLQLAERAGVTISNEELQTTLESIAHQNNTDMAGLQKSIENDGLTFKTFTKSIEQEMIMQRIQQAAVAKRIDITQQDVLNFLNSEEGKQRTAITYHLAHILLPISGTANDVEKNNVRQLAEKIVADAREGKSPQTFSALAAQFSKAQDAKDGGDLGWRKKSDLPSIYADKIDDLETGNVSEAFLAGGGYHILKMLDKRGANDQWVQQTHARHILIKASVIRTEDETAKLLTSIRQQILNGEDFAQLAKKYSEDYGTALKGGDLGWTSPGQLVPQFQQAMDNTAINDISVPFQSQFGWHIVQVLERRQQNMSDEMLKQAARNFLMQKRFEEELPRWLKEIRDEAYVDIKNIDDASAKTDASLTEPAQEQNPPNPTPSISSP